MPPKRRTRTKGPTPPVVSPPKSRADILALLQEKGIDKAGALVMLEAWGEEGENPRGRRRTRVGNSTRRSRSPSEEREITFKSFTPAPRLQNTRRSFSAPPNSPPAAPIVREKVRYPPRFKLDSTYSGKTNEDLREFVRLFRLKADASELAEKDKSRELQCVLRGAAIRWYDSHSADFADTDKLLEGMVAHFTCDVGRREVRRRALKDIKQGDSEQLIEYNARFDEARADTFLTSEDELGCYLKGLLPHLFHKVVGAQTVNLKEAMKAATTISAQLASLPEEARHLVFPPPMPRANTSAVPQASSAPAATSRAVDPSITQIMARLDSIEPMLKAMQGGTEGAYPRRDNDRSECTKCGRKGHTVDVCGVRCRNCNRLGHKSFQCRAPKAHNTGRPSCTFCGRPGHLADKCFKNPASASYKGQQHQPAAPAPTGQGN